MLRIPAYRLSASGHGKLGKRPQNPVGEARPQTHPVQTGPIALEVDAGHGLAKRRRTETLELTVKQPFEPFRAGSERALPIRNDCVVSCHAVAGQIKIARPETAPA